MLSFSLDAGCRDTKFNDFPVDSWPCFGPIGFYTAIPPFCHGILAKFEFLLDFQQVTTKSLLRV